MPAPAAATPKRQVPPQFLGIVADGPVFDDEALSDAHTSLGREFARMVVAGIESVRVSFYWAPMQPYRSWEEVPRAEIGRFRDGAGVPTDFGATDRIVRLAAARGLSLLPVVLQAPNWAARFPGEFASPPADAGRYAAFVRALAERYGESGSFWRERPRLRRQPLSEWQLWNEPTMQSFWLVQPFARDYVALLRATRRALRRADPRARIVVAGLVYESWDALEQLYRWGGRRWFDAVALHPFTRRPDDVLRILERNRTVMARHGDAGKPLYLSELSWPSSRGQIPVRYGYETDERGQARRLTSALSLLAAHRRRLGIRRVYWYTWLTRETSPSYPFDYAGLRRLDRTRVRSKPALSAYRRTALSLEGCRAKDRIATGCAERLPHTGARLTGQGLSRSVRDVPSLRTTATLVTTVTALGSSLAWAQEPAQTPGQTGCPPPGQTGPGQTAPGQTGPGQTGPGQTGCATGPGRPGRPVVSRLRVTPKSFYALPGRRASVARRAGVGISYVVSEDGTARFTIRRLGSRTELPGSFRHGAVRARNELRFTGHLGGRLLAPGRYILIVRVVDLTGDRSRPKRTRFRILG